MILIFAVISVFSYGQEIIVQSTNKNDITLFSTYKNSPEIASAINKLKTVINANPDYSGKNVKVVVKVTFYNSKNNILPLNRIDVYSDDLFYIWDSNTSNAGNRITLNFLFTEESIGDNKNLKFDGFQYQEDGGGEQVPELVADYIKENILRPQNNDVEKIIKKGINAVKNAFDRNFQQRMITRVQPMLNCRCYFKGYSCITTYSYYFQNETINREVNIDTLNTSSDTISLFDYTRTGLSSLDQVLQYTVNTGKNQVRVFSFVDTLKNSKNILTIDYSQYGQVMPLLQNGATVPVSYNTLYLLIKDTIKGATRTELENGTDNPQLTALTNIIVWGEPSWKNSYPTWCNVFAQYLSRYIYGIVAGDFLVPYGQWGKSANDLFDYFNGSPDYIELPKNKSDEIWTKYINRGYPVYFSKKENGKSGHIETGFPETPRVDGKYNKQKFDNSPNAGGLLGSKQFVVGAGGTVGFKSYDEYDWLKNKETKAFLSLKYLETEYK